MISSRAFPRDASVVFKITYGDVFLRIAELRLDKLNARPGARLRRPKGTHVLAESGKECTQCRRGCAFVRWVCCD